MIPNIPSAYGSCEIGLSLSLTSCCIDRPSIRDEDRTSFSPTQHRRTPRIFPPAQHHSHEYPTFPSLAHPSQPRHLTENRSGYKHGEHIHHRHEVLRLLQLAALVAPLLHALLRVQAVPAALSATTHQHTAVSHAEQMFGSHAEALLRVIT